MNIIKRLVLASEHLVKFVAALIVPATTVVLVVAAFIFILITEPVFALSAVLSSVAISIVTLVAVYIGGVISKAYSKLLAWARG